MLTVIGTHRLDELRRKACLYDKHKDEVDLLEAGTHHIRRHPKKEKRRADKGIKA